MVEFEIKRQCIYFSPLIQFELTNSWSSIFVSLSITDMADIMQHSIVHNISFAFWLLNTSNMFSYTRIALACFDFYLSLVKLKTKTTDLKTPNSLFRVILIYNSISHIYQAELVEHSLYKLLDWWISGISQRHSNFIISDYDTVVIYYLFGSVSNVIT